MLLTLLLAFLQSVQAQMVSNNCSSIRMIDSDQEKGTIKLEYCPFTRDANVTVKLLYKADGPNEWKTVVVTSKDTVAKKGDCFTTNVRVALDKALHNFHTEVLSSGNRCLSPLLTVNMTVNLPGPEILGVQAIDNCSSCLLVENNVSFRFNCKTNALSNSSNAYAKLDGNITKSIPEKSGDIVGYADITLNHHMKLLECVVHHREYNLTLTAAAALYVAIAPDNVTLAIEQDFGKPPTATCTILGGRPPANVELRVPGVAKNITELATINKAYDSSTNTYNLTANVLLTHPDGKILICCARNAATNVSVCRNATFTVGGLEVNSTTNIITLAENDSLTLRCTIATITDETEWTLEWIGPNNVTGVWCDDNSLCLRFDSFIRNQTGNYSCIAKQNSTYTREVMIEITVIEQVPAENITAPELNMTLLAISMSLLGGTIAMSAICAAVLAWEDSSVTITEPTRTPPISCGHPNKREVTPSLPPRVNVSANLPGQQRSGANAGPVNPPAGAHGPPKELVYADLDLHNDLGAHRRTPTVRQVSKSEYADIDFTRKATQTVDNRVFEEDFAND